jgi:DeoR/GlpR family transcriptional regulator of sugar metabolism
VAQMSIVPLKQIDILITNKKIPDAFQNDLNQLGVNVLVG